MFNAGRMAFYNHNDEDGLLLTTTAQCKTNNLAQDDNSIIGKILFIDFKTKNYKIFSKGHRNPQGLTIEKNFILSAEHGPTGGDEINLNHNHKKPNRMLSERKSAKQAKRDLADLNEFRRWGCVVVGVSKDGV